jgi:uncharacterized protein DUF3303
VPELGSRVRIEGARDGDLAEILRYLSGPGPVYERASAQGRMLPEGLEYVASWVEGDSMDRGFHLMETSDPALFGVWTERWARTTMGPAFPAEMWAPGGDHGIAANDGRNRSE